MKTVVIGWGRMNPPQTGHGLLIDTVVSTANRYNADPLLYVSQTQNAKKNPLTYEQKIHYIREGFRNGGIVVKDKSVRTLIDLLQSLDDYYDHIVMVGGGDRIEEYRKLIDRYNNVEYSFEQIDYVSAGARDPDADDVSGMSASKMREAVREGDFESFSEGAPPQLTYDQVQDMYDDVARGMGLMESINEQDKGSTVDERKEYYVKKLKDKIEDFKERYGEDWKSVMYATATKMAKDDFGLNENTTLHIARSLIEAGNGNKSKSKNKTKNSDKNTEKKKPISKYVEFNPDDGDLR